ncbi:LacI family transcriptional regulator [Pontibacter sp. E15-1]|uniref:LacI family DNA-binding transcriptional regulator n=1 Tax=Pontibacter sp. E15-1 TaxID=2919918 RepID=UPI001F4FE7C8|nr:LacI family DNA-binding transcriptional regulator [Pontibacter sp. E15-1]MCJ8165779.1 LacI family transcriptional regulator [Pontibacter sp. E15-1]
MVKKKKVSILDIAKKLNISKSTVSFIVNGKARERRISEELTEKVLQVVKEMGYKPNHLAQSLATGKTNSIGLIVENISDSFFSNIASLIEEKAYNSGYEIIYSSTNDDVAKTKSLLRMFRERQVDGYIICPPIGVEEEIRALIEEGTPVVLFDRHLPNVAADYVGTDNQESTYAACDFLYGQGFRHIAFVTLVSAQSQMQERLAGYQGLIAAHGLESYLLEIPYQLRDTSAIERIGAFLEAHPGIDAVCFATNYLAVRGLQAMQRLGLKIPGDIAVVAFDDIELFQLYSPPITSVAQPMEEISNTLINILLQQLQAVRLGSKGKKVIIPSRLTIRESTRKVST